MYCSIFAIGPIQAAVESLELIKLHTVRPLFEAEFAVPAVSPSFFASSISSCEREDLQIFGKGPLGFSIAQSFIISLNIIMVTIINYFNSIKSACKVPQKDIEKNLKKLDRYLKKKPKKKKKRLITIRN